MSSLPRRLVERQVAGVLPHLRRLGERHLAQPAADRGLAEAIHRAGQAGPVARRGGVGIDGSAGMRTGGAPGRLACAAAGFK